jgi:hypothetical protein
VSSMMNDPNMMAALLARLSSGGGENEMEGMGQPDPNGENEGYTLGSIPKALIELTHQAIALEPDPDDKTLLGKILSMLLGWQQKNMQQGQG